LAAEATQAELRVWCLPRAVESAEAGPLDAVADQLPPTENGFPVKRTDGVYYQVRQIAPTPPATHSASAWCSGTRPVPVHAFKLDLAPLAHRVVRRFDAQSKASCCTTLNTMRTHRHPQVQSRCAGRPETN
jgi:hypothetical protein